MPRTLRLPDGGYMRRPDVQSLIHYMRSLQSVSVVGFSNVGKSALLRLLSHPDVWIQELGEAGHEFLPVYIDCNRMLSMTDQGFYELVLRCLRESSADLTELSPLAEAYEMLVAPESDFQVPLSFNRGLEAAMEATHCKLVLLFDEFDEPFARVHSRTFLNLRALKDRHSTTLAFITATVRPLTKLAEQSATVDHCGEFCELFAHRTWHLAPLTHWDVERFCHRYMRDYEAAFTAADIDFVYRWAGGHPTLLEGTCRVLDSALSAADTQESDPDARRRLHSSVAKRLPQDDNLRAECSKIWSACSEAEQAALASFFTAPADEAAEAQYENALNTLLRRHILLRTEGKPRVFSQLLAGFIQREVAEEAPDSAALWVDIESGEVLVGGDPVETLTNLEYRLMLLLFRNAQKIVDKYQIVTDVWGESYLNEVDDARIEKLVSRLRQKVEPDASSPQFLTTVRGRGYRLSVE